MSRVLLVVAQKGFRDEELFDTKAELERAHHACTIASHAAGTCSGVRGRKTHASRALDDVAAADQDAVVFVGGPGAKVFFDDPAAIALARDMHAAKKVVAAICIAPEILANAGVLRGKRATAFETEVGAIQSGGARYQGPGVIVDGDVVTASGPEVATEFGKALVSVLETHAT